MKIKLSQKQWTDIGKKAGWMKTAGPNGMMPGQTPYSPEELSQLHQMVGDAARGDPGEGNEENEDDLVSRRRHVKVSFSDGDSLETDITGTVEEIRRYYLTAQPQDYDIDQPAKVRRPTKVDFIG